MDEKYWTKTLDDEQSWLQKMKMNTGLLQKYVTANVNQKMC